MGVDYCFQWVFFLGSLWLGFDEDKRDYKMNFAAAKEKESLVCYHVWRIFEFHGLYLTYDELTTGGGCIHLHQ